MRPISGLCSYRELLRYPENSFKPLSALPLFLSWKFVHFLHPFQDHVTEMWNAGLDLKLQAGAKRQDNTHRQHRNNCDPRIGHGTERLQEGWG